MTRNIAAFVLMAVAVSLPGSSFAQAIEPGKEGELGKLLSPVPGSRLCYRRSYSDDHLAAHPKQTVREIDFRLAYHRHQPDEYFPKGQRNYYFQMVAKLRGASRPISAIGECSSSGATIFCGVECDGGGVNIRSRPGGKLLVFFGNSNGEIRMTEGCDGADEGDSVELKPGQDDKEFLLNPVSGAACPAYGNW